MIDVDLALRRVEGAVEAYPKAGLFELAEEGFRSPFEILTACMISIRTKDETLMPIARRLFGQARSPTEMADLSVATIGELIQGCAFAARKAEQIHDIARFLSEHYRGELPCSRDLMLSFKGVGPKCANLALGIACGEPPSIPVDVHVHRIVNRWGYVDTSSPERTMAELEAKLPREHWLAINRLLVPFGKHVCTSQRPRCSDCPLAAMCPQIGVERPA
ncbi:MAG: endonuclease III [Candidatus Bipolaricaulia bacterium]